MSLLNRKSLAISDLKMNLKDDKFCKDLKIRYLQNRGS